MKRHKRIFPVLILFVNALFLIAPLLKASAETPELGEEFLCDNSAVLVHHGWLFIDRSAVTSFYKISNDKTFLEDIISYLEKYENSPPC